MTSLTLKIVNDIAVVTFDCQNKPVNVLSEASLLELEALHEHIQEDDSIKAAVIISAKRDNFIAGADINELAAINSATNAEKTIGRAQALFNAMSEAKKPYVAAIHGACLGGGFELALACHFRVASLELKTVFGFPEVMLGLLPAAGGNQRLPRLIGLKKALTFLLSGKKMTAKDARKFSVLDFAVNRHEELLYASLGFARAVVTKKPRHLATLYPWQLLTLAIAKHRVLKSTFSLYPAPLAIIEGIRMGILYGMVAGLREDARLFGHLLGTPVAKNLLRLFFMQKEHQKNPCTKPAATVDHIGIVGAGLMGSGIASVSVAKNYAVTLNDTEDQALARATANINAGLDRQVKKGRITKHDASRIMSRLSVSDVLDPFNKCDLIIEAIVEDLAPKRDLLAKLEPLIKDTCIYASNTSSIPLSEIAANSSRKDRIVGMHYFSPVEKMPLLEVVKAKDTSDTTLATACEVGLRQGKTIIVVNDSAGFYTTRIIATLFDEASILLCEGYRPKTIDHAMKKIGFPMGPVALMDEVGLDIGLHVSKNLSTHFGRRLIAADMSLIERMVAHGFLGRKRHQGFYQYNAHRTHENEKALALIRPASSGKTIVNGVDISERMLLRMVNEAAYCLFEGVIANEEDGDVGAVLGVGFPPYLGGPFKYINDTGKAVIASTLDRLKDHFGERFLKAPFFAA